MAFLAKLGLSRKKVSIVVPTEQDLVKKKLFGPRSAVILDCLHLVNTLITWSHAFILKPYVGDEEMLPGFRYVKHRLYCRVQ